MAIVDRSSGLSSIPRERIWEDWDSGLEKENREGGWFTNGGDDGTRPAASKESNFSPETTRLPTAFTVVGGSELIRAMVYVLSGVSTPGYISSMVNSTPSDRSLECSSAAVVVTAEDRMEQ